jgi:hypothetical protein
VTPSLPQRGRQSKGSIPLTPLIIAPVSRKISLTPSELLSHLVEYLSGGLVTKSDKNLPAPPSLEEALRRGTLPNIDNFTNFPVSMYELIFMLFSPEPKITGIRNFRLPENTVVHQAGVVTECPG